MLNELLVLQDLINATVWQVRVLSTARHVGICLGMAVQQESCTVTVTIVQLELHMALVPLKLYGKYLHK